MGTARHSGTARWAHRVPLVFCIALMAGGMGLAAAGAQPARAHAGQRLGRLDTSGYTMTLQAGASSIAYGGSIWFTSSMTYPASSPPSNNPAAYAFVVDGQANSVPLSGFGQFSPYVAFSLDYVGNLLPGQHSVIARYTDPATSATVSSPAVSFTVTKVNSQTSCSVPAYGGVPGFALVPPGGSLSMSVQVSAASTINSGSSPVDWTQSTVTIVFTGPTTITVSAIHPDSNGNFPVNVPSQTGRYQIQCDFNGSAYYNPSSSNLLLDVSYGHALGQVDVTTSPATLPSGTSNPFTISVVFHAAPGAPVPTGAVTFYFGNGEPGTGASTINPDGTLVVKVYPDRLMVYGELDVQYQGDGYYAPQTVKFTTTNPPSSGGSGGSGGGASPSATGTPRASATRTAGATPATTFPGAGVSRTSAPGTGHAGAGSTWALLLGGLALLLLLLGGGGFVLYRALAARRAHAGARPPLEYESQAAGHWDGETTQPMRTGSSRPPYDGW